MKAITFLIGFVLIAAAAVKAQTIVGTWQLVKQTTCLEENLEQTDPGVDKLIEDMAGMSSGSPQVIEFKANNTGVESIKLMDHRKSSASSNFLYKLNENGLYILDKKSHTLKDAFVIEKLTSDSLIYSNATRPCELKIFLRIK